MAQKVEFLELDFYDSNESLIALSFGSIDFRNISKRKGTFSKTIEMPSTKVNDSFFGMAFDPSNVGYFDDRIRVPIIITEIEFSGTLQLKSVNLIRNKPVSYSVNIFSDLADWASLIGEGSVRDLKHHSEHILSGNIIVDSWSNTGSNSDYVYPLINYGNFLQGKSNTFDVSTHLWRPSFFVLPLIRQIFGEVGFKFVDKGYIGAGLENYMLPFTSKEVKIDNLTVLASVTHTSDFYYDNDSSNEITRFHTFGFNYKSDGLLSESYQDRRGVFTPPASGTYEIVITKRVAMHITSREGLNDRINGSVSIVFIPEDGVGEIYTITNEQDYLSHSGQSTQPVLEGAISIHLDKNKAYRTAVRFNMNKKTSASAIFDAGSTDGFGDGEIVITARASSLIEGSLIDHARFIPNVKKIDLINDVISKGNFRIETDSHSKTVEFITEDKFLTSEIVDLTDKIDHSKASKITHIQNIGSKELSWGYSNDSGDGFINDLSDRLEVDWATRKIVLESEYRKGASTVFRSVFSSTVDGTSLGLKVPVMSTQEIVQGEEIEEGEFATNFENRCLIYGGLKTGRIIVDGVQKYQYPYCFFVGDDISLQYNNLSDFFTGSTDIGLIDRFYQKTIGKLNDSKMLSTWVYLNELDIANLSFRKTISINGVQYYLNLVDDYIINGKQSTRLELISK